MMHLRQPIQLPKGRELRVLIHARFSTEEQRQSSIDDQITACRAFLEANLPKGTKPAQVTVDVIKEPEISGAIADRPGINQVWAGIESKRWDLIIAEESSRLYRHYTKAPELFESAVILRQLLEGPIRVIPFMRIDGKRAVPRLEFTLNLVAALPTVVAGPLRQAATADGERPTNEPTATLQRRLVVNAFDEPQLVKHARVIVQERLAGKTYKEIAQSLDLTEYHMANCAKIVKLMEAAGLSEPYRRLTEKPDHVPQQALAESRRA